MVAIDTKTFEECVNTGKLLKINNKLIVAFYQMTRTNRQGGRFTIYFAVDTGNNYYKVLPFRNGKYYGIMTDKKIKPIKEAYDYILS